MREADRIDLIKKKLIKEIEKNTPNLFKITGKMGVEIGTEDNFFPAAKKASAEKTEIKDKEILWFPIIFKREVILVCGIKNKGVSTEEEVNLVKGLLDEIAYDQFLKQETVKLIDPRSNFIKSLLETEEVKTYEQAIDKADILGINLRTPQAAIFIKIPGLYNKFKSKYRGLKEDELYLKVTKERQKFMFAISSAFAKNENNIIGFIEPEYYVVLKWAEGQINTLNSINYFKKKAKYISEIIEKETGLKATVGVGQYYPKLSGLRKSYNDSKVALELGSKIWGEGNIYHIVDVGMFVALSNKFNFERKCELAYQVLGKIFGDKSLYKTVNVFLENDMNLTEAAKKLHLHRNTLIYRLDKIKKEIGLDPRNFSDAIQIKLGMILYSPSQNVCEI